MRTLLLTAFLVSITIASTVSGQTLNQTDWCKSVKNIIAMGLKKDDTLCLKQTHTAYEKYEFYQCRFKITGADSTIAVRSSSAERVTRVAGYYGKMTGKAQYEAKYQQLVKALTACYKTVKPMQQAFQYGFEKAMFFYDEENNLVIQVGIHSDSYANLNALPKVAVVIRF